MKPIFHNSKAKIKIVRDECFDVAGTGLKDVSDVKRDGNIIVRLRSTHERDMLAVSMDVLERVGLLGWDSGYDAERACVWIRIDSVLV